MKKIFLIFLIFISSIGYTQTYNANLFKGNIFRISDSLNVKTPYSFWGINGHIFDLRLGSAGRFLFRMNGTTDLLDYDYDNGYWTSYKSWLVNGDVNITGSYKVNGVALSTGGGDAFLGNRQTFTKRNLFSDTVRTEGLLEINSDAKMIGQWKSNLDFIGGVRSIGSADNNDFLFQRNGNEALRLGASDISTTLNITTLGDMTTSGLTTTGNVSLSGYFLTDLLSQKTGSRLNIGTDNNYGINFKTNGVTRLSLDTTGNVVFSGQIAVPTLYTQTLANLTGTTSLAQLTLTDEVDFSGGNFISDIPIAKGSVPSIGTTDNFGINIKTNNVTRLHIDTSGNATLSGKLSNSSLNANVVIDTSTQTLTNKTFTDIVGNYIKTDNTYVATKVLQSYISSTGAFVNIAHGLGGSKWKDITNISAVVIHDSTGLGNYTVLGLGYNGNVANTVGSVLLADSLDAKYFVPASSTGLKGDTVKITIQYHK